MIMDLFLRRSFCLLIICASIQIGLSSSDKVPLMVWTSSGGATILDEMYPEDIGQQYSSDIPIVAFIQNRLDLEQFSQKQLPYLSRLFDETDAKLFPYSDFYATNDRIQTVVPLNGETIEDNEQMIKSYVEHWNKTNGGPVLFMLTGKENPRYEKELARHRRAADDAELASKVMQYPFDKDPYIYLYTEGADLVIVENSKERKTKSYHFKEINIINGAEQPSDKDGKWRLAKMIEMKMHEENSSNPIEFTLKMDFTNHSDAWKIRTILLTSSDKKWKAENLTISTERGFSYSCMAAKFILKNDTLQSPPIARLTIHRFQLQPFVSKTNDYPYIFEPSFDCSEWFTLPLLAGIMVILVLITILYIGIRAVMSISTPDRFENPKSKGLILTNVEE